MLPAFGVSIVGCIANFIFVIYLVGYAINTMKLPPGARVLLRRGLRLVVVVLTPFVGVLSDRIGRRPLILACALLNLVFDYPLFLLAIHGGTFETLLLALVMQRRVPVAATPATIPSILAEMFPTRVRYTGAVGQLRLRGGAVRRVRAADLDLAGQRHRQPVRARPSTS